jgi:hypothetical protein
MPKKIICIEGTCFDTNIDVESKEIKFVPKEGAKCNVEALNAFKTLYKDPTATMKLVEKIVPKGSDSD